MKLRRVSVILLVLAAANSVKADFARHTSFFSSANGLCEAKLGSDRQWNVVEKHSRRLLYSFPNDLAKRIRLSSMTLAIGNDGASIVAIDDFSEQLLSLDRDPEVLWFFRGGQKVKSYKLSELIDPAHITFTTSHFTWCFTNPTFTANDGRIHVTSNELLIRTFDLKSGNLLSKEYDPRLEGDAIFITGSSSKIGKQLYEVNVVCSIKGDLKPGSKITFTANRPIVSGSWSWIIRDGKLISGPMAVPVGCTPLKEIFDQAP